MSTLTLERDKRDDLEDLTFIGVQFTETAQAPEIDDQQVEAEREALDEQILAALVTF